MIAILADAFVKSTIILLLAGGVTLLLRRSAASLRHLVWTLACGAVLVLPLASALLPNWRVAGWPRLDVPVAFDLNEMPQHRGRDVTPAPTATSSAAPSTAVARTPSPTPPATTTDVGSMRWRITPNWTTLIFPVWLSGVAAVLILLAVGLARIAWLDRITTPVRDERWLLLVEELSLELGLARHVRLRRASGPAMPMTWGIRRPTILIPADADEWSAERRRDVLLHELAHVKRHDFLTQLVARVGCAVYWFHPLVWLAATRLREERERACDDHVLNAGASPSVYATHLLEIARDLRAARATVLASVAMARPAQLATRLLDVLDTRRRRDTLSARSAVPAWIAAIVVVVPLAAAAPRPAGPGASAASIDTIGRLPSRWRSGKHAMLATAASRRVAGSDTLRGCSESGARRSSHSHEGDGDVVTISITTGNCAISFDGDGKFTFNDDFTDIATLASGGRIVIKVDYGAHDRRLTIERGPGGALEREYKVDGSVKLFDDEARTWLAETLTLLFRRSGFMAEERARWILDRRGIQGLITELGEISGDYGRRLYYEEAVKSGLLDAVVKRPGMSAGMLADVLASAKTLNSDYELAELLTAVGNSYVLDETLRPLFFAAAGNLSSDYEHGRTLRSIVERGEMPRPVTLAVLESAKTLSSDYERAELLIAVIEKVKLDDTIRAAIRGAVQAMSSSYDRGRVYDALERD